MVRIVELSNANSRLWFYCRYINERAFDGSRENASQVALIVVDEMVDLGETNVAILNEIEKVRYSLNHERISRRERPVNRHHRLFQQQYSFAA